MYICQYCGKEVALTLYDPKVLDLEVCEKCFKELPLSSPEKIRRVDTDSKKVTSR
jgi:DNA-directed RNA polymerase subunit RPC12/RpoP